ncbi:lipid-binding SYLF domain-containing protein [Aeromonas eucrenophila]|uniref:YSC84-related protein n=1 Tax=Aeromonas eucrenophila TaxID=649 RepID=A0ABW0YIG8_9GAMM|nr:YSC84-related protein [Aeromonas eucrenophila]
MKIRYLALATTLVLTTVQAQAGWDDIKSAASELGSAVAEGSKEAWNSVSDWGADAYNKAGAWTAESAATSKEWLASADKKLDTMLEPKTPTEARTALDTMADTALVRLFNEQPSAKLLFDKAYGYAVFDSRKFSLMVHTNQGAGVAVNRSSNKHTYMKMFGAGMASGFGGKFYQQVMLFETKKTFDDFVNKGWEATSDAGVVAGKESASLDTGYNGGMAIYQIGEKGLMYGISITGSKYWIDEDLTQ